MQEAPRIREGPGDFGENALVVIRLDQEVLHLERHGPGHGLAVGGRGIYHHGQQLEQGVAAEAFDQGQPAVALELQLDEDEIDLDVALDEVPCVAGGARGEKPVVPPGEDALQGFPRDFVGID